MSYIVLVVTDFPSAVRKWLISATRRPEYRMSSCFLLCMVNGLAGWHVLHAAHSARCIVSCGSCVKAAGRRPCASRTSLTTVVREIPCRCAAWVRLSPLSRSATTALRSMRSGMRPIGRPSNLRRRIAPLIRSRLWLLCKSSRQKRVATKTRPVGVAVENNRRRY